MNQLIENNTRKEWNLDLLLPDTQVLKDLRAILDLYSPWPIAIETEKIDVSLELNQFEASVVISKCYYQTKYDIGRGDHFRVLVALGGLKTVSHGTAVSNCCFCIIYYNLRFQVITDHFCTQMP